MRRADHPALGLCVDSFHILSRGSDPAGIRDIPGEKLFFLQLADAPYMDMDVLQWSRHYRLFPGQGTFDLPAFLGHVLAAGYAGPLSLEVFNDVFRQSDPRRAAVDALRSLLALREATVGSAPGRTAHAPARRLRLHRARRRRRVRPAGGPHARRAGLRPDGQAPLQARRALDPGRRQGAPELRRRHRPAAGGAGSAGAAVSAIGVETADPPSAARRAEALLAPVLPRTREAAEADLSAVAAPDGTAVFFCRTGAADDAGWLGDFTPTGDTAAASGITHVDHVALTQPFDRFDEAALFYRSVLGLEAQHASEVAAPFGLVRNRAVADPTRAVRVCLSVSVLRRGSDWQPGVPDPQHVAFASDDVLATARAARAAGAPLLAVPDNYYDDLDARLAPPPEQLAAMRELGVLLDRDANGEFLHFYTDVLGGRVFFEVVQRIGAYPGYGEVNSPVRMAAHRRQRTG